MKKFSKKAMIGKMMVFGAMAVSGITFLLMFLWNNLMPLLFGLTTITFIQAFGLLLLSKILFGNFRNPNWRSREMSNMHKEQFYRHFRERKFNKANVNKEQGDSETA